MQLHGGLYLFLFVLCIGLGKSTYLEDYAKWALDFASNFSHPHEPPESHRHISEVEMDEFESLGEIYYKAQKIAERTQEIHNHFKMVEPNFPCIRGAIPLGSDAEASVKNGHRISCGIQYITHTPIVYSFRSYEVYKNQDLEIAFLKIRPDANILVFNKPDQSPPAAERDERITYVDEEIGYDFTKSNQKTLTQFMKKNNHTYVDVLNLSLNGEEWQLFANEKDVLSRVGQLYMAIGLDNTFQKLAYPRGETLIDLIKFAESQNLRLYSKEVNQQWSWGSIFCSFVQRFWGDWDETKSSLPPLSGH